MRIRLCFLLLAALVAVYWLAGGESEAVDGADAGGAAGRPAAAAETSGYRVTGANWSTDRSEPVYVPPHQRRALASKARRKAEAAARDLDERSLLDETAPTARVAPGSVIDNPYPGVEPDKVAIE